MSKQYVVEARVCDTIKSVPVNRQQATQLKKVTKAKLGKRAKVKVKSA